MKQLNCLFALVCVESQQRTEARLQLEHRQQMSELHDQIKEKEDKIEEIIQNYETHLQV